MWQLLHTLFQQEEHEARSDEALVCLVEGRFVRVMLVPGCALAGEEAEVHPGTLSLRESVTTHLPAQHKAS